MRLMGCLLAIGLVLSGPAAAQDDESLIRLQTELPDDAADESEDEIEPEVLKASTTYIAKIKASTNAVAEMGAISATDRWIRTELSATMKAEDFTEKARERFIAETEITFETVDRINTNRLQDLLRKHSWADLFEMDARLAERMVTVANHAGHDNEFRAEVLTALKPLVDKDIVEASQYATNSDKLRIATGKKQIYGTQMECQDGDWAPLPLQSPAGVEARRKSVGLGTMAQNKATMIKLYGACPKT